MSTECVTQFYEWLFSVSFVVFLVWHKSEHKWCAFGIWLIGGQQPYECVCVLCIEFIVNYFQTRKRNLIRIHAIFLSSNTRASFQPVATGSIFYLVFDSLFLVFISYRFVVKTYGLIWSFCKYAPKRQAFSELVNFLLLLLFYLLFGLKQWRTVFFSKYRQTDNELSYVRFLIYYYWEKNLIFCVLRFLTVVFCR